MNAVIVSWMKFRVKQCNKILMQIEYFKIFFYIYFKEILFIDARMESYKLSKIKFSVVKSTGQGHLHILPHLDIVWL